MFCIKLPANYVERFNIIVFKSPKHSSAPAFLYSRVLISLVN
jgi:hypothetical protein